jgi:putative ABC transport system substrate-binding protein
MKIRTVLVAAAFLLATGPGVGAGDSARVFRIGALNGSTAAKTTHMFNAFREGLREHGLVEGENLLIEYRWAEGKLDRLPELAADLVGLKVDLIFAPPTVSAVAARKATRTIPIVFAVAADPVGDGLAESLSRPGGNVTGMSTINVELGAKRLQLLKEAFPRTGRVAVLHNPADSSNQLQLEIASKAAETLGVRVIPIGVPRREDLDSAFANIARERADAVFVMENPVNFTMRRQIVERMRAAGLPAIYALREFVDDGGLMAYSVNTADQFRRAAGYVAKILKGARPGELPVEQPTRVDLVINLKTAKAESRTIPRPVLLRADEVIR